MNNNYYAVIMAGGIGSRFWPLSRTDIPKQFLDILGVGKTMIRQTFERLVEICPIDNIFVVTSEKYKILTLEQIPELNINNVLCEPVRKNTAPCIAYSINKIITINPEASVIVAPSDHIITKNDVFVSVVKQALNVTREHDCLITLGIIPSRPDTGYGYIQFDDESSKKLGENIMKVKTFTEKPNKEIAENFINSGDFLWNSGIFIWSAESISKAFNKYLPDIYELFEKGKSLYNTSLEQEFIQKTYYICENISIDYGIMEKAENVYVYSADFGWSDLGTWSSLFEHLPKNDNNNAFIGSDFVSLNSKNNTIVSHNDKLIAIQGINDIIVVDEKDVLLICNKNEEQKIRNIVDLIRTKNKDRYL